MTNTTAIGLASVVLVLIGVDLWFDSGAMLYLGRKMADLVRYIAFWH